MKTIALAFVTLMTCGSDGCKKSSSSTDPPPDVCRTMNEARVESARILRSPVLCEGESACKDGKASGGFTCTDGRGGLVTCPPNIAKPCTQNAGPVEIGPMNQPTDAGVPKD